MPPSASWTMPQPQPKRILLIRLDRIGDVVLSLPVAQALRQAYPHAFIAMMVRAECADVVRGHPAVDDVILYKKEHSHRSPWKSARFAWRLRSHGFDTALVLHPSNRSHWIPWLAGIPVRIGYARKSPWLLTHRVPHRKQEGAKHEAEYTFELLSVFGIAAPAPQPVVAVRPEARERIDAMLAAAGVRPGDLLVAVHPSASCASKRWPAERFAEVANRLAEERGTKICLIASAADAPAVAQAAQAMRHPALNFAGRLSLSELAALLARCRLLISNDSGPVHIAAGVGTQVVDIFGRNERGLSPVRWGPLGDGHVVLQREVGCATCLAHKCDIKFLCLTALAVDDVYRAALSVLDREPAEARRA